MGKTHNVTAEILANADRMAETMGIPNPYRRVFEVHPIERQTWEREHGHPMPQDFLAEEVATKVKEQKHFGLSFQESRRVYRQALPGELEALRSTAPVENWDQLAPTPSSETVKEDVLSTLDKMAEEMARVEASIACGAHQNPDAKPCTLEQEGSCQWFRVKPNEGASLMRRTKLRPAGCPRLIAYEQDPRHPGRIAERVKAAADKRIPANIRERLIVEGRKDRRPALDAVRAWHPTSKPYLVLSASNQAGKTFSACAWLEAMDSGVFLDAEELWEAIKPGPDDRPEVVARRRARAAKYVVLDNVESHLTNALRAEVDALVRYVGDKGGRMVITTSMPGQRFLDALLMPDAETGAARRRIELYGEIKEV